MHQFNSDCCCFKCELLPDYLGIWRHLELVGISLWSLTKFLLPNISINSNWRQARLRHVPAAMLVLQCQLRSSCCWWFSNRPHTADRFPPQPPLPIASHKAGRLQTWVLIHLQEFVRSSSCDLVFGPPSQRSMASRFRSLVRNWYRDERKRGLPRYFSEELI
jgi:hypothetical protein